MTRRPCWAEISTSAFQHNYCLLAHSAQAHNAAPAASRVNLLAIVKADAYGHGLRHCAPAALRAGAQWLGVTSIEEGVAARLLCDESGFPDTRVLVIAGPFPGQGAAAVSSRLTNVVWEPWQLAELDTAAQIAQCGPATVPVHLELDTGMSRQGAGPSELESILAQLRTHPRLRLDGLMTHLYAADESDGAATQEQFTRLEACLATIAKAGHLPTCHTQTEPLWLHVGNSAAVLAGHVLEALQSLCQRWGLRPMVRPGLALYGLAPEFSPANSSEPEHTSALHSQLRPVLQWKTQVVSVRSIAPGEIVGYNGTFVATEPMRLALLAVGYADGLNRALSNRGAVLIHGHSAPIVGRISMDQTVVDVTEIVDVVPGDEAVLLGHQGTASITAEDHAAWAGTIPWEIFTSIHARVERRPA